MAKITRYVFRPIFIVTILVSLTLAWATVYDSLVGDGAMPEFIPADAKTIKESEKESTKHLWGSIGFVSQAEYWERLRRTLLILDEINPTVSGWVRQQHRNHKISFVEGTMKLAKYDYFSNKLVISSGFFTETEKGKVSLVCHEYRHSRQNFAKIVRYIVSFSFGLEGKPEIVENDACLFAAEAETALTVKTH